MKRVIATLIVAGSLSTGLWADPLVLSRESSVELALANNSDFRISEIELETASRESRTAWNSFLPSISAGVGLNGSSSFMDSGSESTDWRMSGSLNVSLPLNASLVQTIKGLRLALESEEITHEAARRALIGQVEKEFYYLIAVEADIAIQETNIDLARQRYEQTSTNYEYGLASELTVLQAEVTAANLQPPYLQAVSDYEARVREYLIVLGLDPDTNVELEGRLESPQAEFDAEELIRNYLANRADIRGLQMNLEMLRNRRSQTAVAARTPSLNLSAGWSTSIVQPFDSGSWEYETWSDQLSLGLNLSIPLDGYIPGSSDAVSVEALDDEVAIASINLAKAAQKARTEILNLVAQLETSAASMELSELNVDLARRTYELSEESYARGILQRLDVEDAQQEYLEANQQLLLSRYEYLAGLIDLRTALGLDSLEQLI